MLQGKSLAMTIAAAAIFAGSALAQEYPTKPITLIVPWPAGGSTDIAMRAIADSASPLVLAFVLGPMLENNLRKSLILSQGDLLTFVQRPISATCLALAAVLLVGPLLPSLRKKRELVALDEGA